MFHFIFFSFEFHFGLTLNALSDQVLAGALPPSLNRKLNLDKPVSKSEVAERFRTLLIQSVDHVLVHVERDKSAVEANFAKGLLLTLVHGLSSILQPPVTPSISSPRFQFRDSVVCVSFGSSSWPIGATTRRPRRWTPCAACSGTAATPPKRS